METKLPVLNKISIALLLALIAACASKYAKPYKHDFCKGIRNDTTISSLAGLFSSSENLLKTKTGVYVLEEGVHNFVTRAWCAEKAQKTIDIQYYIFSADNSGLIFCDYLVRAADRGVKVRIIIDDITAKPGANKIHALDVHENIEIKIYNSGVMRGNRITGRMKNLKKNYKNVHQRMHNKTITVDDLVSITGGRNIDDKYFDFDRKYNFRDRDVLLIGRAVADVKTSFEQFWKDSLSVPISELYKTKGNSKDADRFQRLHQYACDPQNFLPAVREKIKNFPQTFKTSHKNQELFWVNNVSFVSDVPGKNRERENRQGGICTDSLIALVKSAKSSIDIQSGYLIMTQLGKNLFSEVVKRGVKVRVLTNSLGSIDNFEAFSGYQRDRNEILATGIEVYEFKPNAEIRYKIMSGEVQSTINYKAVFGHHAKTMIIDGHTTIIGGFNIDPRSANLNTECVVIIRSPEVSKKVSIYMEEEFLPENSWRITPDFNPDSEAGNKKRLKAASRKIVPKKIL